MTLQRLSRAEFLEDHFVYRPGESIGLFGNTGSGKSYLGYQLAEQALKQNPQLRFNAYLPKAADDTSYEHAERLGLQITHEWPPKKRLFSPKPPGYLYHPDHVTSSADKDVEYLSVKFKTALNSAYWTGSNINFVDDAFLLHGKYKCANELEQFLIAGRSSDSGMMFALQSPKGTARAGVSSWYFSQPVHMFWNRENVESNREKYSEVACGIDPKLIMSTVANLRTFPMGANGNVSESLYINRRGPYAAIISPW